MVVCVCIAGDDGGTWLTQGHGLFQVWFERRTNRQPSCSHAHVSLPSVKYWWQVLVSESRAYAHAVIGLKHRRTECLELLVSLQDPGSACRREAASCVSESFGPERRPVLYYGRFRPPHSEMNGERPRHATQLRCELPWADWTRKSRAAGSGCLHKLCPICRAGCDCCLRLGTCAAAPAGASASSCAALTLPHDRCKRSAALS